MWLAGTRIFSGHIYHVLVSVCVYHVLVCTSVSLCVLCVGVRVCVYHVLVCVFQVIGLHMVGCDEMWQGF